MDEKKNCLEGIRAIACIGVLLCHFRGAFIPNRVIPIIDNTPLRIMTAGNPMVRIMFVISGFVISYKYFRDKQYNDILVDVTKRWFRLFPAILFANIFVCLMMKCGFMYNFEASEMVGSQNFLGSFNQFTPSFSDAIIEGLFTTFLDGSSVYIGPLWSMVYEFMGTLLILSAIAVFKGHYTRFIFYLIQLMFFNSYYNYLIIGMLICDIYFNSGICHKLKSKQLLNNILCILAAIVICMISIENGDKIIRVIYGVALMLFFVTLLHSKMMDKILGNTFMCGIGKLSFAIYIVHWPVIESFSSFYYIKMMKILGNYRVVVVTDFLLTVVIVLLVSIFVTKFIVPLGMFGNEFWRKRLGESCQ